ncbi:hypothetical protein ABK040_010423 [Willaertia magna]
MVSLVLAILAVGIGTVILKPQELPKYSRILGRFAGKSLKMIMETKSSLSQSKDTELLQMKREFDHLMSEVATVRSEVRKGFNLRTISTVAFNPEENKVITKTEDSKNNVNNNTIVDEQLSSEQTLSKGEQVLYEPITIGNENNNNIKNNNNLTVNSGKLNNNQYLKNQQSSFQNTTSQLNNHYYLNNSKQQILKTNNNLSSTMYNNNLTSSSNNPFAVIVNKNIKYEPPIIKKRIEPNFSLAYSELQEIERKENESDPTLQYFPVDQNKVNTYDYELNNIPFTNEKEIDIKESPFSVIDFGHKPLDGLYDDTSIGIRTEQMGGGADFISVNELELLVSKKFGSQRDYTAIPNKK